MKLHRAGNRAVYFLIAEYGTLSTEIKIECAMKLGAIIEDIQECIFSLQQRVDDLKAMDDKAAETILFTRQQATDFIGKSLRRLDRDCRQYGIRQVRAIGGTRIPQIDLFVHMGLVVRLAEPRKSDLQRVL